MVTDFCLSNKTSRSARVTKRNAVSRLNDVVPKLETGTAKFEPSPSSSLISVDI